MIPEGSLACSQKPATSHMNPVHILTPHFRKIHFNIILPSTPTSPKFSFFFIICSVQQKLPIHTRAVWKVRGLTLLLRVGTLWRCHDGLFFEVPLLASDGLLTTLHPLLENVLQTVDHFEISCLGAPSSWLEKPRDCRGRLGKVDRWNPIRTSTIQSRSRPMRFLGFFNNEKGAPTQEISKWSTVCSTFSRSGWSVVRSASLAKGGTSKKRPSPHLHKVPTQSNELVYELFKRPPYLRFQKVLKLCTF
jgi:hypothetical protein